MKGLILVLLITTALDVFGQDSHLVGKYSKHMFISGYSLILSDGGRYTLEETSCLESMGVSGIWTIANDIITLTPISGWRKRSGDKNVIEIQRQWLRMSFFKVDDYNTLTQLSVLTSPQGVKTTVPGETLHKELPRRANQ